MLRFIMIYDELNNQYEVFDYKRGKVVYKTLDKDIAIKYCLNQTVRVKEAT